jgi:hypothetical protein
MGSRNIRTRLVMSMALVVVVTIALILPTISYAFSPRPVGFGDGSVGNGYIARAGGSTTVIGTSNGQLTTTTISPSSGGYTVTLTTYNHNAKPLSQTVINVGPASKYTFTTYNTQTTITKTYTQYVYYTTVVNNYITKYMMPIIKWEFTLVNVGQLQEAGYHMVGSEKLFTPGSGGNGGIFVPVFSQEAIYAFNIAPSVKPQVVGWYTAGQSQYTTSSTTKSATPPQLSGIQDTVNTIRQLATVTIPNVTRTTTNWVYSTSVFNNKTTVFILPTPYYYNNPNQNFALAWQSLTQGNIAGAAYYTGKGIYENLWNAGAWAVQQAFYFVSQASNAFNTATLTKAVAASIYGGVEGVGNALGQLFTKSWWSWP